MTRHPPASDIERQLVALFRRVLFVPIARVIQPLMGGRLAPGGADVFNAKDSALATALKAGRIQYADGVFSGRFSAAISGALRDVGAVFDRRSKVYRLAADKVPVWIISESTIFRSRAESAHKAVLRELDIVQANLDTRLYERPIQFQDTLSKIEDGWKTTARQFAIRPEIGPGALDTIRREWSETAKLPIKNFAVKEVQSLRAVVEKNASQGYRFEALVEGIKARYDVARNKAKFLARNETSIFMSKFREERFKEAGVRRYRWSTSEDARVRPALNLSPAQKLHVGNHRRLNGKVFFFDSPPVVDPVTGRRANPGEDYNCRCIAIPILDAEDHTEVAS